MKNKNQFMSLLTSTLLVGAASISLSSCGGDDSVSGASGSLSANLAGAAAGLFLTGANGINLNQAPNATPSLNGLGIQGMNLGASLSTSDEGADPFAGCRSESPANPVDDDNDGIAKEKNYSMNCLGVTLQDGFQIDIVSKFSVRDYDDTKQHLEGGYRIDLEYSGKSLKLPDYDFTYDHLGYFEGRKVGGSFIFDSKFSASFKGQEREQTFDFTWKSNYSQTFTPENLDLPWNAGKASFSGFIGVEGNLVPEQVEQFLVAWEISSKDLVYRYGTCNTFESGSMFWKDGAGQIMEIRFSCNSYDVFYQGQAVTVE